MTAATGSWAERFDPPPRGPDKVLPLDEALRRAVRPGATLHFAFTHDRPSAAMAELLRQHVGRAPGFTLVHLFTSGPAIALLTHGLVGRLVTSLVCDPYPAPGPSRAAGRALADGRFTVEHWSVLSLVARLEAGARGLPALPVRGLAESSLLRENAMHARVRGGGVVEVAALRPDVSFVHAPCADRLGNALLAPPYGEGVYGALASKDGVVVTTERLVEPETLRRHAHLLALPASHVRSVSVVPLGAHPAGLATAGVEGVEPYGDDADFYAAARAAGRTEATWREFVERWYLGPRDHEAYLARLGGERLLRLKGKARPDAWRVELPAALEGLPRDAAPTRAEGMVLAAAALLAERARAGGHRALLAGFGAAGLAAWVAHAALREASLDLALVAEIGLYGYLPRPCDPYLFNFKNLATCTARCDSATALGLLVQGPEARCLASLGAAQVDAAGRLNTTRLQDGTLLVGSGGLNDVASAAQEVVVTVPSGRERLVEAVPYVTGPGERVTAVVTDQGVFEKPPGPGRLRLTRLVGPVLGDVGAHVQELRARCGFTFEVAPDLSVMSSPSLDEVARLRLLDPARAYLDPLPEPTGPCGETVAPLGSSNA